MRYNNDTCCPAHPPDVYGRRRPGTSWRKKHFAHSLLWLFNIADHITLTWGILVRSHVTVKKKCNYHWKQILNSLRTKKITKQLRQINLCRLRCYECTEQILTPFWEFGSSGLSLEDKPSFHLIWTYKLLDTHMRTWSLILSIVIMFISRAQI